MQNGWSGWSGRLAFALACLAAATGESTAAARDQTPEVLWNGDEFPVDELPGGLAEPAKLAIANWTAFAGEHGYRMLLAEDQRSLLLVSARNKRVKSEVRLIESTSKRTRELAPGPVREAAGRPEGERSDDLRLGVETAVIVRLRESEAYEALLRKVGAESDYLGQPWVEACRHTNGFILSRPLCSAFLERPAGIDEWDVDDKLVHRLTQLLVTRDFGPQPFWLTMGLAWNVEYDVRDGIYCFPYREGFVFASEHGSWLPGLRNSHRKRESLTMSDMSGWYRGGYDAERAQRAWGTVRFLAEHRPGALPEILEELRLLRDEKSIEHGADGSWRRLTDWTASAEDQLEIFRRHAGDDVLAELLLTYFQKGKRYRPKR